jgi:hypothetical protein
MRDGGGEEGTGVSDGVVHDSRGAEKTVESGSSMLLSRGDACVCNGDGGVFDGRGA